MKHYLAAIKIAQTTFLAIGIALLAILPSTIALYPDVYSNGFATTLYTIAHTSLVFVMLVRPLADIFIGIRIIRPLVILRKGLGVLSASIIVSFIIAKLIVDPSGYFASMTTLEYWSIRGMALFAHLADLSAVVLLVTSNNLSKRVLGVWWKRVQKLSYVYFYGSAVFVFYTYTNYHMLVYMIGVTLATYLAYILNKERRNAEAT